MRELPALVMALFLGLSSQIFIGCSSGEKDERETAAEGESLSADLSWKDVPVYPKARAMKGDSRMADAMIERSRAEKGEIRFWETDGSTDAVISFYEAELPKHGWERIMGMKMGADAYVMTWHKTVEGKDKGITVNVSESRGEGKVRLSIIMGQGNE